MSFSSFEFFCSSKTERFLYRVSWFGSRIYFALGWYRYPYSAWPRLDEDHCGITFMLRTQVWWKSGLRSCCCTASYMWPRWAWSAPPAICIVPAASWCPCSSSSSGGCGCGCCGHCTSFGIFNVGTGHPAKFNPKWSNPQVVYKFYCKWVERYWREGDICVCKGSVILELSLLWTEHRIFEAFAEMHLKQWRKTQFFVAKELQEALDFFSQDFFLWVLFRLITELQGWICVTGHLRSSDLHGSPSPLDAMRWLVWRVQRWAISTKSCDGLKTEGFWMISFQGYASLRCVPFLVYRDVLCFPKGTWRL